MRSGALMLNSRRAEPKVRYGALLVRMYRSARAVHPGRGWRELWHAGTLFMRQVERSHDLRAWHRHGNWPLQEMLALRPSLVSAVRRPYINTEWGASRRLAVIEEHYRHLAGRARHLRVTPDTMVRLATLDARGQSVEIMLDSPAWFVHEGELSLNLFFAGERIYTLVFSLGFDAGKPVAYVGALQGLGSERALQIYRSLTHAMHGLRPRELLLAAFRLVCKQVGVQRVLAVSDRLRVSASPYFIGAGAQVHSSYDAVWQEHLGQMRVDGFYDLPVDVARRTHESIPARKRSEYRQRYEMLDRLGADLSHAMAARNQA